MALISDIPKFLQNLKFSADLNQSVINVQNKFGILCGSEINETIIILLLRYYSEYSIEGSSQKVGQSRPSSPHPATTTFAENEDKRKRMCHNEQ